MYCSKVANITVNIQFHYSWPQWSNCITQQAFSLHELSRTSSVDGKDSFSSSRRASQLHAAVVSLLAAAARSGGGGAKTILIDGPLGVTQFPPPSLFILQQHSGSSLKAHSRSIAHGQLGKSVIQFLALSIVCYACILGQHRVSDVFSTGFL